MRTGNIHEAKTHLSPLVEKVAKSESFVIARAGKPLVNVVPIDDVDTMGREEIGGLFEGGA